MRRSKTTVMKKKPEGGAATLENDENFDQENNPNQNQSMGL